MKTATANPAHSRTSRGSGDQNLAHGKPTGAAVGPHTPQRTSAPAGAKESLRIMKAEWIKRRLQNVTSKIGSGATPLGGETAYKSAGVSLIRSLNVHDSGFRMKDLAFLDDAQAKDLGNVIVAEGDVLLNITGASIARCCIVPKEILPARVNQHVAILRPTNELLPKLLQYMLISKDYKDRLLNAGEGGGSTRQALTKAQLQDFEIEFPSQLHEQHRLVTLLDQVFAAIATAKANTEKNLQNAHALFESHLHSVFSDAWSTSELGTLTDLATDISDGDHLPPPKSATGVPFITIGNIVKATRTIDFTDTFMVARQYFDGLKGNKKPKKGDVLYTVTGSFGIPVIIENDIEFCFQRHIGLIRPKTETMSKWLYYLLLSPQVFQQANERATGTAQKTVSLKVLRSLIAPKVVRKRQESVVAKLDNLYQETQRLASLYQQKLTALDALKKSLLHQAFTGQLTADEPVEVEAAPASIPFPIAFTGISTTDMHAGILAMAHKAHEEAGKLKHFGHVKSEKISHLVEFWAGISLGRESYQEAAGPNDYPHLKKVEHRARMAGFFDIQRSASGMYTLNKLRGYEPLIEKTRKLLGDQASKVDQLIQTVVKWDTQATEILATVFAAWNNLLIEKRQPSDEEIVTESRENWHPDKLKIPRQRFFDAIKWMRDNAFVPEGKGKKVLKKDT